LLALAAILEPLQGWFLGGAAVLLAVDAVECYRGQKSCRRRGRRFSLAVLGWWDVLPMFPPGLRWEEKLPQPALLDGTVVDVAARLEELLRGPDAVKQLQP
jgi:hypothetical protein